jgi:hypothetical protein
MKQTRHMYRRGEVDGDFPLDVVPDGWVLQVDALLYSCVVDEHVDIGKVVRRPGEQCLAFGRVRDIAYAGVQSRTCSLRLGEFSLTTTTDDDSAARLDESFSEPEPDSRSATGHEHRITVEIHRFS